MLGSGSTSTRSGRTVIHRGKKFDLELVEVPGADGKTLKREVIRHPGAVVILPILDDGQVVMIRNQRPALGRAILELPAGTLDGGERPEACADRELIEETGYKAATFTPLGRFYTSPGMSDELMWSFAARGLTHVGQDLEEDEHLTVHPMPVGEVLGLLGSGELMDGKSMLTLLLAMRTGMIGNG